MFRKIFCVTILLVVVIGVSMGLNELDKKIMLLNSVEALATPEQGGTGGVDYSKGYINDEKPCTITETAHCSVSIYIPFYGYCSVEFDYTVDHEGTKNYCKYTGGPSGCSFHECKKNK